MDFWTRLLESIPNTKKDKEANTRDPTKRLNRFEKEYSGILDLWRKTENLASDTNAIHGIESRLAGLIKILNQEAQRPLPHPCIQFAAVRQIYSPITRIATQSYNKNIILQTIIFFATLIDGEEENFVESPAFAASLTNLLTRITGIGINTVQLGHETESRMVEVAFNITTKIRMHPEILPVWFKGAQNQEEATTGPNGVVGTGHNRTLSAASRMSRTSVRTMANGRGESSHERFTGRTVKREFPLFYVLIDYIHHEGKIGDFARTGLLYIIEAADSNVALEQWIVESDLSTLMATGLGAQYSQLSRKLVIDYVPSNLPPVLAFSDYQHPPQIYEVLTSCSDQFQRHLSDFLSHLLFWQDVLNHCKSIEIKSTLLEHFQVIFLQQLLYPSLLESSDIDGGSSVAVLTYLRRILESLDHPDMINLILHYLLALPNAPSDENAEGAGNSTAAVTDTIIEEEAIEEEYDNVSRARKRKSMDLANLLAEAQPDAGEGPLLFNLVDLILACLRSHSEQTILVTLQLVSSIIKRHHRYAVITLLHTESVPGQASRRTMGAHSQEVEYLMTLAGTIGGTDNFEELYEAVVKDTTTKVEGHLCSLKLVDPNVMTSNHGLPTIADSLPGAPREVRSHTLRPDDPLLNAALDHLETFLLNPVDMNLTLTETILDLAICGFVHLEGWLLRHPQKYEFDSANEGPGSPSVGDDDSTHNTVTGSMPPEPDSPSFAEYQRKQQLIACRRRPKWTSLPRMLVILEKLTKEVTRYRNEIPRFDDLLQQRREAFLMADYGTSFPPRLLNEPPTPQNEMLQAPSLFPRSSSTSRNTSPVRGLESFAQRILTDLGLPELGGSPSPPPPPPLPRGRKEGLSPALFPLNTRGISPSPIRGVSRGGDPSRSGSIPPQGRSGSVTPDTRREHAKASKMAAFAAMDQSTLSRKIGSRSGLKDSMQPVGLVLKLEHEEKLRAREARKQRRVTISDGLEVDDEAKDTKVPEVKVESNPKEISTEEIKAPAKPVEEKREEVKQEVKKEAKDILAADTPTSSVPPTPIAKDSTPATPTVENPFSPEGTPPAVPAKDSPKPAPPPKEPASSTHTVASTINTTTATATATEGTSTVTSPQSSIKRDENREMMATVSHVLTNVIILQSFLFELSALVQVRAGLFDEVRFV